MLAWFLTNSPAVPVVIGKGKHVFPFSFKFPDRSEFFVWSPCYSKEPFCPFTWFFLMDRTISTSFKFNHGRILHKLRVQLKQHKTRSRWITTVINFVSEPNVNIPRLMVRSYRLNLPLNSRGRTSASGVIVTWVCSFRNLRMSARWRRSHLALEVFRWTFTLSIRLTSKVTRSPDGRSLKLLLMNYGLHVTPVILHLCADRSRRRGAPGHASSQQPLESDIEAAVRSVQYSDCKRPDLSDERAP